MTARIARLHGALVIAKMTDRTELMSQCEVKTERVNRGGQHVGNDVTITVMHKETGVSVVLPPICGRSQHKRVQAGLDVIEYLLAL